MHYSLKFCRFVPWPRLLADDFILSVVTVTMVFIGYYIAICKSQGADRKKFGKDFSPMQFRLSRSDPKYSAALSLVCPSITAWFKMRLYMCCVLC